MIKRKTAWLVFLWVLKIYFQKDLECFLRIIDMFVAFRNTRIDEMNSTFKP
jgi:hypothetical protein